MTTALNIVILVWSIRLVRVLTTLSGAYLFTHWTLDEGLKPWFHDRALQEVVPTEWMKSREPGMVVPARLPGRDAAGDKRDIGGEKKNAPAVSPSSNSTLHDKVEWEVARPEDRRLLTAKEAWLCLVYQCWRLQDEGLQLGPSLNWLEDFKPDSRPGEESRRTFHPQFIEGIKKHADKLSDSHFSGLFVHLPPGDNDYRLAYIDELGEKFLPRKEDRDRLLPLTRVFYDRYRRDNAVFWLRVVTGKIQWWTFYAAWIGMLVLAYRFATGVIPGFYDRWKFSRALAPGGGLASLGTRIDRLSLSESRSLGRILTGLKAATRTSTATVDSVKSALRTDVARVSAEVGRRYWVPNFCRWCVPCLGFLGTVVGLSETLMGADGLLTAQDKDAAVQEVTLKLGYKFDTTGVALVWSIALTFLIQLVYGLEEASIVRVESAICKDLENPVAIAAGSGSAVVIPWKRVAKVTGVLAAGIAVAVFLVIILRPSPPGPDPEATVSLDLPAEYKVPGTPGITMWVRGEQIPLRKTVSLRLRDDAVQLELRADGPGTDTRIVSVKLNEGANPDTIIVVPEDFPGEFVTIQAFPRSSSGIAEVAGREPVRFTGAGTIFASRKQQIEVWLDAAGFVTHRGQHSLTLPRGDIVIRLRPAVDHQVVKWSGGPSGLDFMRVMRVAAGPNPEFFHIASTEITQQQFMEVMGVNPSWFKANGANLSEMPVEGVSWMDAAEFCNRLNARDGFNFHYDLTKPVPERTGTHGYRLPSFPEWRKACLGDNTAAGTKFSFAPGAAGPAAWFKPLAGDRTHSVAGEGAQPNSHGIYNMHGNVREWLDEPSNTDGRRLRGTIGGSYAEPEKIAAADRDSIIWLDPRTRELDGVQGVMGFRIVLIAPPREGSR